MKWSFRIARIAGIDVRIHATFFLLLVWIAYMSWSERKSVAEATDAALFTAVTFVIIVLHEFGHALTARAFGIRTRDITLLPIGGLARLERMPDKPWQEFLVAIAGPAVNVVLGAIAVAALAASGRMGDLFHGDLLHSGWLVRLAWSNAFLAGFNMLPAFPMDGGRVLRALLAMQFEPAFATAVAARLGQAVAILFIVLGLAASPMFALIGLFVWIGASEENRQVQFRVALAGIPVWQAMATEIRTLAPSDPLERAAMLMTRTTQTEFPVLEADRVAGILTRPALLAAIGSGGLAAPVAAAMSRDFAVVSPTDPLDRAFLALQASPVHAAVVVHEGRLVGLLTSEEIGELAAVHGAVGEAVKRGYPPPRA
ncbi:MAG: peptidase [Planctomycetota bacterium]|nr:MAG: peptidase [Planctomycetota bacterium]